MYKNFEFLGLSFKNDNLSLNVKDRILNMINSERYFLFMKGVPSSPRCGFSARVVDMLEGHGINYKSFDVLSDMDIREGVKEFSSWPTIPQFYVDGEFVGGCDILEELVESGSLKQIVS